MNINLRWVENARALAVFCVITIHVVNPISTAYGFIPMTTWLIGHSYESLSRFCIPLFFMITGAIMLNRDYELTNFLKKRTARIIPPFMFWTIVYVLFNIYVDESETRGFFVGLGNGLIYGTKVHFWFVYSLVGVYLMIPILRKWVKLASQKEVLYFLIIWLVTLLAHMPIVNRYLPKIDLINFTGYLGYVVLGFYLNQIKVTTLKWPIILVILGTLVSFIGIIVLKKMKGHLENYFYEYLTLNVVAQASGWFLIIKKVEVKNILLNRIITMVSKHGFGIYLVHILILELLHYVGITASFTSPVFSVFLTTCCCLTISSLLIYFLQKIKWCSYISG